MAKCPKNQSEEITICVNKDFSKIFQKILVNTYGVESGQIIVKGDNVSKSQVKKVVMSAKKSKQKTRKIRVKKLKSSKKGSRKNSRKNSRKKGTIVIKTTTPSINRELRVMTSPSVKSKLKNVATSFSPAINRAIASLRSLSPNPNLFNCTKKREIRVQTEKGVQCVGWKTQKAQTALLNNLRSKKKVIASNIIAPKQIMSNCWFNTFFMCFFISDKGRKFNRGLREMMIKGVILSPDKKTIPIDKTLQWPFFKLNKYIEASLRGRNDPNRFAELMDTNEVIEDLYKAMVRIKRRKSQDSRTRVPLRSLIPVGKDGNPLAYYNSIMYYFQSRVGLAQKAVTTEDVYLEDVTTKEIKLIISETSKYSTTPEIVFVTYHMENAADISKHRQGGTLSFTVDDKLKYALDSAILIDTKNTHFSSYLTIEGKEYAFDGESFSPLEPFQWKNKIHKNTQWRFSEQYKTYFNFRKAYQILIYYRIK